MPARKSYKNDTFTGILKREGNNAAVYHHKDALTALGKLSLACVRYEAACYYRANKDGSITCRVYTGDDKYEEVLRPGDDVDYLVEQMIEALFGMQVVGEMRRASLPAPAERPAEPRKRANPTQDTHEGANGA